MSTALMTTGQREKIQEMELVAAECRQHLANIDTPFEASFALAKATRALDALITDEMMADVMELRGNPLGFRTDRDAKPDPYDTNVVRPAFIEATVRGFRPVNNEWNIIAGRFYGCLAGFKRLVRTFPGIANFEESVSVPERQGGRALVSYVAAWELEGEPMRYQRSLKKLPDGSPFDDRIVVRVNEGMGDDAILGKAYRKAYAGIYDLLNGHAIPTPEGDVSDAIDVDSAPSKLRKSSLFDDAAPSEEPGQAENQEPIIAEYASQLGGCAAKTDVSRIAKQAGGDARLTDAARRQVMELCQERRKQV